MSHPTSWRVVSRHRSLKLGGGHLTTLALRPHTGRTFVQHCCEFSKQQLRSFFCIVLRVLVEEREVQY